MQFLTEADKIKSIFRRNRILNGERQENDAEHSWQPARLCFRTMLKSSLTTPKPKTSFQTH